MSEQTEAALDAAIRAHIESECDGALTTAWALIAANATDDDFNQGQTGYWVEVGDRQPHHVTLGLVAHHLRIIQADAWELSGDDE